MALKHNVKHLKLANSARTPEFDIKLRKIIKEIMSSRTNQQLLMFALILVVLGASFAGITSLVSVLVPPFAFYKLFFLLIASVNLVVIAYGLTWMFYLSMAQHEREFFLPYEPQRILKFISTLLYVLPGSILYFTLFSEYVYLQLGKKVKYVAKKDIPYGSRVTTTNSLDVYMPEISTKSENSSKITHRPVIVFIYGGAWSSGNKLLYTLLALRLTQLGYVVVVPNYTLYPESKIEGMISDVKRALFWTKANISNFGGDPDNIHAMGHSAGAHIVTLLTTRDAIHKLRVSEEKADHTLHDIDPDCALPKIAGLILMSGVYDIQKHYGYETATGLEEISAMKRAMGGSEESFVRSSPTLLIQNLLESNEVDVRHLKNLMPPKILIMHGEKDGMVPVQTSISFGSTLKDLSIENLRVKIYPGMEHSEPVTCIMKPTKFTTELLADLSDFIAS